jgi:hypothetical protein
MSYVVIENFCDKTDGFRPYLPGAEFPRKGLDVSEARIKELLTDANALKKPLIKEVEAEEKKKAPAKKAASKKSKE